MTPEPPSSPDDSSPPLQQRPSFVNLGKASAETDLWSFDEDEPIEDIKPREPAPSQDRSIPIARLSEAEKLLVKNESSGLRPLSKADKIQVNVKKSKSKRAGESGAKAASKAGREFDDLDNWEVDDTIESEDETLEDLPEIPEIPAIPELEKTATKAKIGPVTEVVDPPVVDEVAKPDFSEAFVPEEEPKAEQTPSIPPKEALSLMLAPLLSMSKLERIGLITLLALVILGGGSFLIFSIYGLPTESERVAANDFPIKGERLEITEAVTYWRTPIIGGPTPDIFRRGTVFLPTIKLQVSGRNAALRVVFRNQDGELIGDVQTRAATAGQVIEVPATAGFDDAGMHAAYRTGESKPWTVHLSEAATVNSPASEFKKLFEMNISTDRR